MARMLFPNLPVSDVARARTFWTALGFGFDENFSSDEALAMVVNDTASVMLLEEKFFHSFHDTQPALGTETLTCLGLESREEVDLLCRAAGEQGAEVTTPTENGPMYGGAFRDLDGHLWEVMFMDLG